MGEEGSEGDMRGVRGLQQNTVFRGLSKPIEDPGSHHTKLRVDYLLLLLLLIRKSLKEEEMIF